MVEGETQTPTGMLWSVHAQGLQCVLIYALDAG